MTERDRPYNKRNWNRVLQDREERPREEPEHQSRRERDRDYLTERQRLKDSYTDRQGDSETERLREKRNVAETETRLKKRASD